MVQRYCERCGQPHTFNGKYCVDCKLEVTREVQSRRNKKRYAEKKSLKMSSEGGM
jgi:hypothetical protein